MEDDEGGEAPNGNAKDRGGPGSTLTAAASDSAMSLGAAFTSLPIAYTSHIASDAISAERRDAGTVPRTTLNTTTG